MLSYLVTACVIVTVMAAMAFDVEVNKRGCGRYDALYSSNSHVDGCRSGVWRSWSLDGSPFVANYNF